MPYCVNCGGKLGEELRFCPDCGAPNFRASVTPETAPARPVAVSPASAGYDQTVKRVETVYAAVNLSELPEGFLVDSRYEVVRKIGQGGFGAVYLVSDREMKIEKALKVIPESMSNDKEAMENLKSEASVMVRLNHPNIVRVYDLHTIGPVKYIDMEYVEGQSLAELKLKQTDKRFAASEALPLLLAVAQGLEYAHSKGVLHRDIKPQNVLVDKDGAVKLMDFGISETMRTSMSRLDNAGTSGTLAYMSPEQVRGRGVGKEADIYSFGAMLYELLSGHPPFWRGDVYSQILKEPPEEVEDVSDKVNMFLMQCLAKDYRERFSNCTGVIDRKSVV